jgi:hypothetical protein
MNTYKLYLKNLSKKVDDNDLITLLSKIMFTEVDFYKK